MWVCDDSLVHVDVVVVTKLQELFASKLGVLVDDDRVLHSKPVDDVGEE
jgi:hypothetical protein